MSFAHPWVLLGLWLAPLVAWWWIALLNRRRPPLAPFLEGEMAKRLAPPVRPLRLKVQWLLAFVGLVLGLLALAGPRWGEREELVMEKGRDVVIAVDVSRSMLARDVRPNRLLRAKADVMDLLRSLRGDRAGLVAFRGSAVALCPLTTDYAYLEQTLDALDPDSAPRGATDLGDAIEKALAMFDTDAGGHRAIILITDGEDLAGRVLRVAEQAKKQGVAIFTVGLGDPAGAAIPADGQAGSVAIQYQGQDVISKMDGETLQKVAEITGGAYVPVGVRNVNLGSLYADHLARLSARDIEETLLRRHVERYQWFLFPAVLALLGAACLSRGRLARGRAAPNGGGAAAAPPPLAGRRNRPVPASAALLVLATVLASGPAIAVPTNPPAAKSETSTNPPAAAVTAAPTGKTPVPSGRDGARLAQTLYGKGLYQEAADAYTSAAAGQMPALQNLFLFNAGCAAYAAGDFQAAANLFRGLEANPGAPDQAADIRHNLGCALVRLADQAAAGTNPVEAANGRVRTLELAGAAFQKALRDDAGRAPARANLAVVTQSLAQAREQARVADLMARYGNQPAPALADQLLSAQRLALVRLPEALTNATPARIGLFEGLARDQSQNADILMPLKSMLLAAGQQQKMDPKQLAEFGQHVDAVEKTIRDAGIKLRDLDEAGATDLVRAEKGVYQIWKSVASHDLLLREDLLRQTNALVATRQPETAARPQDLQTLRENQAEGKSLTDLFRDRFAQAYPEDASNAVPAAVPPSSSEPGDTNAPPDAQAMTPEKRAKILELARQASEAQQTALQRLLAGELVAALPEQETAYARLKEIQDLLPKDQNQQQQQQNQQDQQQQDQKDQKQDQQKQDSKDQQQDQPQPEPQQDPPKPDEQKPEPQQAESEPKPKQDMTQEQAREILLKALQREKEYAEEKRRQDQIPMSPVDRDW
jgi:hypothetical protein